MESRIKDSCWIAILTIFFIMFVSKGNISNVQLVLAVLSSFAFGLGE